MTNQHDDEVHGELDDQLALPVEEVARVDSSTTVASQGFAHAALKVKTFPQTPGVYLMKDAAGRVIYVGKAKNLRSRASSYFLESGRGRSANGELGPRNRRYRLRRCAIARSMPC